MAFVHDASDVWSGERLTLIFKKRNVASTLPRTTCAALSPKRCLACVRLAVPFQVKRLFGWQVSIEYLNSSEKALQVLRFPEQLCPRPLLPLLHAGWLGVDGGLHGAAGREGEGRELVAGVPARL